ncbi:unnamed protein product, partial [Brassica oleracea]
DSWSNPVQPSGRSGFKNTAADSFFLSFFSSSLLFLFLCDFSPSLRLVILSFFFSTPTPILFLLFFLVFFSFLHHRNKNDFNRSTRFKLFSGKYDINRTSTLLRYMMKQREK